MSDSDSEEEDIYHTMLLKAYRNTSTPELTAKVAAKLAREQKLSECCKEETQHNDNQNKIDKGRCHQNDNVNEETDVKDEVSDCQHQQTELTVNTVLVSTDAEIYDHLSLAPGTSNYNQKKKQCSSLSTEVQTKRALKREAKRQRQQIRRQSRLPPPRSHWATLNIDLMERIYRLLSVKERHIASQVCPHWFECFYSPFAWSILTLSDYSFTKRKFNYYLGYQRMICPFKTQAYLKRFGHTLRSVVILPMANFYNLFEFMALMEGYALYYEENPLVLLNSFDFTFGCQFSNGETADDNANGGVVQAHIRRVSVAPGGAGGANANNANQQQQTATDGLIGTGGKILETLTRLLGQLVGLKHLALRNLLLAPFDAQHLLDNVAINCFERLRTLTLINCTNRPYAFLHTGVFIRLETLVISSSHLSDDVLSLLADIATLRHFYIVQNEYTRPLEPMPAVSWRRFSKANRFGIKLHLAISHSPGCLAGEDATEKNLTYQEAPITSLFFDTAYIPLRPATLNQIISLYSNTIECLAFYQMPKYAIKKSYNQRVDAELINFCQSTPKLSTLIIRELISTSTLLIIVSYARNLTRLYVRRNALRRRFDAVRQPQWPDSFYNWLAKTSRSYDDTFAEVSAKLGYSWNPLTDAQFKTLRPDVRF